MNMFSVAVAVAGLTLAAADVPERPDCDAGYQTFLGDFSRLVHTINAPDAVEGLRKSLAVYDACKAGDSFEPGEAWRAIIRQITPSARP